MSQTTHPVVLFQKRLSGPGVMLLTCNAMLLCMVIASLLFWQSHALLVTAVAYGTAVILWIGVDIGREASRERESIGESARYERESAVEDYQGRASEDRMAAMSFWRASRKARRTCAHSGSSRRCPATTASR